MSKKDVMSTYDTRHADLAYDLIAVSPPFSEVFITYLLEADEGHQQTFLPPLLVHLTSDNSVSLPRSFILEHDDRLAFLVGGSGMPLARPCSSIS